MEVRVLVRGDRACFKRPEFVEDMVSYDVVTPLAATGILEAVYDAPDIRWRIDEIRVLLPIRSTWMALNEVAGDPGAALPVRVASPADRRMASVLRDVGYVLTARIEHAGGAGRAHDHAARFRANVVAGRFFRPPFLGLRGFPAEILLLEPDAPMPDSALGGSGAIDLGWMLFDRGRDGGTGVRLFRPTMIDGVIDLLRRDSLILAG